MVQVLGVTAMESQMGSGNLANEAIQGKGGRKLGLLIRAYLHHFYARRSSIIVGFLLTDACDSNGGLLATSNEVKLPGPRGIEAAVTGSSLHRCM
jgi:hypothetical protein